MRRLRFSRQTKRSWEQRPTCQNITNQYRGVSHPTALWFYLKPAHLFLFCPQTEPAQQKSFKRKRSLINWPFWKGSNTQLDGLPLSPTLLSPTQGRLFGRPLSSVCSPDHGLPKPVMVSQVQVMKAGRRGSGPTLGRVTGRFGAYTVFGERERWWSLIFIKC